MAALKLLILLIALICTKISADSEIQQEITASDSALKLELEQLKSKISGLELSIEDEARELKTKDETVLWLKKIIDEKSDGIQSLQSEIDSLQKRGSVETNEQVGKAHARASELEKQVEKLKKEIEAQKVKKDALEARTTEAETKIQKLDLQLQNLQKINDEQKHRIRKTERALQVSEEEMVKFTLEATSKSKELIEGIGLRMANRCSICGSEEESAFHFLVACPLAREVWSFFMNAFQLDRIRITSSQDLLKVRRRRSLSEIGRHCWKLFRHAVMWALWLNLNNCILRDAGNSASQIIHSVHYMIWNWSLPLGTLKHIPLDLYFSNWANFLFAL